MLGIDITGGTLAAAGSSGLIGGATAAEFAGSWLQNRWARSEAQRSRDWSERMSSTAYQRSTADMRAAGLNPMLLAGHASPAGAPSGAQAPVVNPTAGAVSTALEARRNKVEVQNAEKEGAILDQEERKRYEERMRAAFEKEASAFAADIASAEAARARRYRAMWDSPVGRYLPYLDSGGEAVGHVARVVRDLSVGASSAVGASRVGSALKGVLGSGLRRPPVWMRR